MFGSLGGSELLLILVLALLLFGPRRLPQIGRMMGKAMGEFRKATSDLKVSLEREVQMDEIREVKGGIESIGREIKDSVRQVHPRRIIEEAEEASAEDPKPDREPTPRADSSPKIPTGDREGGNGGPSSASS